MLWKSRYVQIRELELDTETDKPPTGKLFDGRFFPHLAFNNWHWRQTRRLKKIIQLRYMIVHDYEELIKKKSVRIRR